jgi:hypothetical protein
MSNQYLAGIHEFINREIEEISEEMAGGTNGDAGRIRYLEGRLEELRAARSFLSDRYDLKSQIYY